MAKPDAAQVAKILRELARRMELEGGNPYRARAYARAAENLSLSQVPLERLIKEARLKEVPGIGDSNRKPKSRKAASGVSYANFSP
jgi:DNA polymerase (family 10)